MVFDSAQHFHDLYDSVDAAFSFKAQTRAEWQVWQAAFRTRLCEAVGLDAIANDLWGYQPVAQRRSVEEQKDHLRESWILWVEPTVPLPFYVLRPLGSSDEKRPLVLTPHGHNHPDVYVGIYRNEDERRSAEEGDRDIAVQAVREGYLVISPTVRGFGETRTQEDLQTRNLSSCHSLLMHDLLLGRTPIGDRVWDISRLIDWALEQLNIDEKRIAITGNSGGGTVALHAAALDTRISVAVPSSYFCTYAGSIGSIHHCDCNYIPGILRLGEMYDVAGLTAPRAFRAITGRTDGIFPLEHTQFAFKKLQNIYTVAGVPDYCELYIGEGGHRYYRQGAWGFIRKHFEWIS